MSLQNIVKCRNYLFKSLRRWRYLGIIVVLMVAIMQSPARSQADLNLSPTQLQPRLTQPESPVTPSPTAPGLNDPQEFAAFVDEFFQSEMSKEHIPGAAISVVKDGKLFFANGYGYANVEKKIPVVPDQTLFRVASLSKLFTATAAMQLYERGVLDLHTDVNQYLSDFQLDNPYSEPVTAARLMMHTDGTTKRRIGLAAPTADKMQPLGDYLAEHMPPVIWRPGELYSYSSHSTALLGYLVERLSKTPFTEYIESNLFQPLEMERSTFLQPLPSPLAKDLAVGYQYQNDQFQPVPFLYLNIAPAAALSTTATDMANFMIAHLQAGRYGDTGILQPKTVQLMHDQHFTHHPKLPGTGYSFRERLENNIRMIGHLGSLRGYSSSLTLMPDRNIGIFIGSNSFSGIHEKLLAQLLDRYFPVANEAASLEPITLSNDQLDRFTGTYRDLEYPRHTFAKVSAPFEHINIRRGGDGTLVISTPRLFFMSSAPKIRLVPVEPLLFQRVDDDAFTAFGEDESGKIAYVFNPIWSKIGAYERVPWYETIWVQLGILGFCTAAFLSAVAFWIARRLREEPRRTTPRSQKAWLLAALVSALNLAFLIGLPLSLWRIGVWKLAYGVPSVVVVLLCLPIIAALLAIGLPLIAAFAWKNHYWSALKRWHYSLIALAAVIFIPALAYWNLLGFHF